MPALIVFAAGAAVAVVLAGLSPAVGSALAVGVVIGLLIHPLVVGVLANW